MRIRDVLAWSLIGAAVFVSLSPPNSIWAWEFLLGALIISSAQNRLTEMFPNSGAIWSTLQITGATAGIIVADRPMVAFWGAAVGGLGAICGYLLSRHEVQERRQQVWFFSCLSSLVLILEYAYLCAVPSVFEAVAIVSTWIVFVHGIFTLHVMANHYLPNAGAALLSNPSVFERNREIGESHCQRRISTRDPHVPASAHLMQTQNSVGFWVFLALLALLAYAVLVPAKVVADQVAWMPDSYRFFTIIGLGALRARVLEVSSMLPWAVPGIAAGLAAAAIALAVNRFFGDNLGRLMNRACGTLAPWLPWFSGCIAVGLTVAFSLYVCFGTALFWTLFLAFFWTALTIAVLQLVLTLGGCGILTATLLCLLIIDPNYSAEIAFLGGALFGATKIAPCLTALRR